MVKLVFIERDGVLTIENSAGIAAAEEVILYNGAAESIAKLNKAGIVVALIEKLEDTKHQPNQIDLHKIHSKLILELAKFDAHLDEIYSDIDRADSLNSLDSQKSVELTLGMKTFNAPPKDTLLISNKLQDLISSSNVGCGRILVKSGEGKNIFNEGIPDKIRPVTSVENLEEAVNLILKWDVNLFKKSS